jgi:hypothetical protein
MHARVTTYEDVDLDVVARIQAFMEAQERDPFADLPGYRGSMTLVDRENARLIGIGFYESAGHAREAEAILATMPARVVDQVPEDIRPVLAHRPDSVGLYEVAEDDRPGARAAGD